MSEKKAKTKRLSLRERKFIKNLAQGMTQREAALNAGYSPKSADQLAYQALQKPSVRKAFAEFLDAAGVTDEKLALTIAEGLEATKSISCNVIVKGKDGEPGEGMADAHSMTKDFVDVPDFLARHKFADTALKVKGAYAAEKVEHSGTVNHVVEVVDYSKSIKPKRQDKDGD